MTLALASDLKLPVELVTESVAILARKRMGKSNTAKVLVEQLFRASQPVVVVDPKGDWWGLRSSRDGKGPGLPIVVLGGEHGDVPLEATGGELVARLVVEQRVSVVLDLSIFRKHEVATFMAAFLETLYRLKAKETYRTPVMLAIDEADAIAPQKPAPNEARMLGAAEDIVRRGGQRGIGVILVSQRAAVLNKNVLTQASILIALGTTGSQDLDALDEWIKKHGKAEERAQLMGAIAMLPRGTAWVWAPGWPTERGIFRQVQVNLCETFDSGATPKPGERRVVPKTVADVDLQAFRHEMAATIEKAKADDPKALRAEIVRLKGELAKKPAAPAQVKTVEKLVVKEAHVRRLEALAGQLDGHADRIDKAAQGLADRAGVLREAAVAVRQAAAPAHTLPTPAIAAPRPAPARPMRESRPVAAGPGDPELGSGGLRRMMIALAQRPGLTNRQLGVRAGLSSRSGTFSTYLSRGRRRGWIAGDSGQPLRITDTGLRALGTYEPLPVGQELLAYWLRELGESGAARILRALAEAYPKALSHDELGERAEISARSGTFSTYLSRLRTLELIEGRAALKAADEFFA